MDTIVRVELASRSGLEADKFVNTFACTDVDDHTIATNDAISEAFRDFYNVVPGGGLSRMGDFLSSEVEKSNGLVVKLYDGTGKLAGGPANPLGSPYWVGGPYNIAPAEAPGVGLPSEVAVCITLEGTGREDAAVEAPDGPDAGGAIDRPKQRHTGRIFFGPLNATVIAGVAGQIRPDENILDTARLAVDQLASDLFLDAFGTRLGVWSRRNATIYTLEAVSVDNSFDTVRSRGNAPTTRQRTLV